MKVLHVISSIDPRTGGPAAALLGLATAQQSAGIDVRVASTYGSDFNPDLAEKLKSAGIAVSLIGPVSGPLANHPTLKPTLRSAIADADVVHIHALWESIQHHAARACRAINRPYIFTAHGMLDPWSLNQSKLKKKIYMLLRLNADLNGAAKLHFTTPTEANLVRPLNLTAPTIIVPNGIDLSEFDNLPAPGSFRGRHPKIGVRPIVLFLSRLHYKKGLDLLIPAFAQVHNRQAILIIAGPDSDGYQAQVQQMVQAHQLTDRVIFTGMLHGRDRIEALVDANLFCLPSYQENFGIAVAEALAAGTPVIISDQVNLCDQVLQGQVGAVVPCEIDPLASELNRWLDEDALRADAAGRAGQLVRDRYDWKQIAMEWQHHYRQIVDPHS